MSQKSLFVTADEMSADFMKGLRDGEASHCPTCRRYCKMYRRRIHSNMARQMIALYNLVMRDEHDVGGKLHVGYAHTRQVRELCGYSDFTLAKHWNLVQAKSNYDEPTKKETGLWTLTGLGLNFVTGKISIAKYAFLFDDQVIGFSDEVVTIREALGKKFNYQELMDIHPTTTTENV